MSTATSHSTTPQRICILGATNRIQDIDEAILRRMPKRFPVALPSASQRHGIFSLILRDTKIDQPNFDLDYLVRISAGMSGSDIKEACRDAAMQPMREFIRKIKKDGQMRRGVDPKNVRGLRTEDFFGRGRGLRETEDLYDVKDEVVNAKDGGRRIHTTEESEDETSSASTQSGDERFRDSAYHDADPESTPQPVR